MLLFTSHDSWRVPLDAFGRLRDRVFVASLVDARAHASAPARCERRRSRCERVRSRMVLEAW